MAGRLTDAERADRKMNGGTLQGLIVDAAVIYGYAWCHWRALQNRRGMWEVPVEGPLGKGWPDLFLINHARGVAIAIEVKRELSDPLSYEQTWVGAMLEAGGIPWRCFRPSDLRNGSVVAFLADPRA